MLVVPPALFVLPPAPMGSAGSYLKFGRVDGDYATVSVAVPSTVIATKPSCRAGAAVVPA